MDRQPNAGSPSPTGDGFQSKPAAALQSSVAPHTGRWMALTAALLGWMFDGAEMGVFSLVGRPAVQDLLGPQYEHEVARWLGVITGLFLVGAATGGVLFGWLGDRIGRVRAMALSILTYALFTGLCGVSTSPLQLGTFRFIASLGMGGEWSLGVALVMEVFPNRSRAFMAGLIGAAANVGYLGVGLVGLGLLTVVESLHALLVATGLPETLVARLTAHQAWRIMMLLGVLPAVLTFFIRLFVPESTRWERERQRGSTSHWATADLLAVLIGALGPASMVYLYAWDHTGPWQHTVTVRGWATAIGLLVAIGGYLFPVVRYLQRAVRSDPSIERRFVRLTLGRMILAACLSGVALLGTWGATQQATHWADKITETAYQEQLRQWEQSGNGQPSTKPVRPRAKEHMLIWLSVGAIVGTILAALMGDWLGRRRTYFLLCCLSLASVVWLFQFHSQYGPAMLVAAFFAGACSASFYGWLPLYLPELFATRVRATGQGFGFNFGRILAAIGSFQLGSLVAWFSRDISIGGFHFVGGYAGACTTLSLIYVVGMFLIWLAPETRGAPLPE